MFNRPRCRDWMPLATQQLRLRNLIKITGHNIIPTRAIQKNTKYTIYYSLHQNKNDVAFYVSEKLIPHGNGNIDWNEINCPNILKSSSQSICIKIWECELILKQTDSIQEFYNLRRDNNFANSNQTHDKKEQLFEQQPTILNNDNDKLLFTWGVNFSGLILLTKRSEIKFQPNSLAFQMHGGYFASAYSLTQETMRQQLSFNYQLDSIENNEQNRTAATSMVAKSCDIVKSYTDNSNHNNSNIKNIKSANSNQYQSFNRDFQINSPRTSRSCSPVRNQNNKFETIVSSNGDDSAILNSLSSPSKLEKENHDLLDMLQIRYANRIFRISEIRKSYTLNKLLMLQETQRAIKQRNEDSKELTEQICMKSAFCLNLELIMNKGSYYKPKGNPSMGRTLNRLLFQETQTKPEDILKAQELKKKIETAKFRSKLLLEERNRIKSNCQGLEKKLSELHDANIEQESWLMARYRNLSREKETLLNDKVVLAERKELLQKTQKALRQRKAQLCCEIKEIYPIERKYAEKYTISHVYLPNTDELTMVNASGMLEVTPLSLSSALGYVAHVVKMCSIVLNLPLRNPIQHEGSRSRIIDIIKEIPHVSREFPLYSRTFPPPKPVLYAVYLLNQNIAQLNVQANGIMRCDLRSTLSNLLLLLSGPGTMGNFRLQLPNRDENSCCTETSSSSVDLNVVPMPSICSSKPVDVVDIKLSEQRISRSVGSYSNDHQITETEKGFYNSEPLLATTQSVAVHLTNFTDNGNI